MINDLKSLQPDDRVTIDDSRVIETAGTEEFQISHQNHFEVEDGEIVFLSIDNYFLVCYETSDTERYFFYEIYYEGSEAKKYLRKDQFVKSFKICVEEDKATNFKVSEESPLIGDDVIFSQYKASAYFDAALLEKVNDRFNLYVGFEIESDCLLL